MSRDLEKYKQERLGEVNISNEGYEMKIVEYNKYSDIWIEFQDKYKTKIHTSYQAFKKGDVKNPYYPSVYGIGYLGEGKYKCSINSKITKEYKIWSSMLQRCYDPYTINKADHITYKDVFVCEEWHNFQNFAKWYEDNYYEIKDEKMCLDKDILIKGNKLYSPEACIFVPNRINTLFTKRGNGRGKHPIGVFYKKPNDKFESYCGILNENNKQQRIYLGLYDTIEEAFLVYKQFKENYIKQVADEYKDLIPQRLYDAMYKYEVEIND